MDNIYNKIKEFSDNYLSDRSEHDTFGEHVPSYSRLVRDIPADLSERLSLPGSFKIKGSIGQGNFSEIPWICFFDTDITSSAQHGYYIVMLFKSDMSGFYISLNQGWTQYERAHGTRQGREAIVENAKIAQSSLRTIGEFSKGALQLGATRSLGKGYELGNICSAYFDSSQPFSDEEILQKIRSLITIYAELKGIVGNDILAIKAAISEESFQEAAQDTESNEPEPGPVARRSQAARGANSAWPRDPAIARRALELADYKCELDPSHSTFISKSSGKPFTEAHHLVPMEFQDQFEHSLDVPENIVSLCPTCHRKLHLANIEDIKEILGELFDRRNMKLENRAIELGVTKLCSFYQ